jgi:type VI secretion system protein VasG
LIVIPYLPLSDAVMGDIIRLQLSRIAARVTERHRVAFEYEDDVVRLIASRCSEPESGGRMIDAILTNTLLPDISGALLRRLLAGQSIDRVHVGIAGAEFTYSFDS